MAAIQNRYEFVYLFDVENGNPNGDPDAGNMPRIDPETSNGLVTDVCLKRKVRNFVEIAKVNESGFNIYVQEKAVLNLQNKRAYLANPEINQESKKLPKKEEEAKKITGWMCANFFDVRTFGAVMTTDVNCGQVRGPVQINFAKSIDPVIPLELSITRMAVTTEKEAESQSGDNRTMGRKHIVPYGLYRVEGYISSHLAEKTGFSEADLELFWNALINMFDHDHSAARGKMNARKLFVFKHSDKLGNAPAHKLFDLISVKRNDSEKPPRSFTDYTIDFAGGCPQNVEMIEKL
ncbi:type I-C CRISPR-associated protein Cas7/Csd2 [Desulforegula conservatrix]|uniref:type I-C CRISPR-associated protein Cas7/Csd2 n=1 Tax=Desulforegula conservatrix TaxID=153026 RepID=UPI0004043B7A|nr:type I-C CRISPR-associated protein Cas7/Csd2 [Desulforegula conservatrix]